MSPEMLSFRFEKYIYIHTFMRIFVYVFIWYTINYHQLENEFLQLQYCRNRDGEPYFGFSTATHIYRNIKFL